MLKSLQACPTSTNSFGFYGRGFQRTATTRIRRVGTDLTGENTTAEPQVAVGDTHTETCLLTADTAKNGSMLVRFGVYGALFKERTTITLTLCF